MFRLWIAPPEIGFFAKRSFPAIDAKSRKLGNDCIDGTVYCCPYRVTERAAGLEVPADDSNEKNILRAGAQHLRRHDALGERRGMRIESLRGRHAENVSLAIL